MHPIPKHAYPNKMPEPCPFSLNINTTLVGDAYPRTNTEGVGGCCRQRGPDLVVVPGEAVELDGGEEVEGEVGVWEVRVRVACFGVDEGD